MASNKSKNNKPVSSSKKSEPASTKWLRIFLIAFSIMLVLSMILSLIK
jgi:hypothetical protein